MEHVYLQVYDWFEWTVFLILERLPCQGWKIKSTLQFTHNYEEYNWIQTFLKGINGIWNANSLVQSMNSGNWAYFLWR